MGAVLEAATVTTAHRPVATHGDHQLVSLVRAGDDRAFEELFARYRRRITAYVFGMVSDHGRAEDITQEVFVSALRRMRETERPIAFRPWIYEIAKNACIDSHRRRSRGEEISLTSDDGENDGEHLRLVSSSPAPEDAVDTKQRLDHLCGAFGGLSEAHHEILVLRELEGLSYREIGERMGLSRPAVESTLFRARRRLTAEYNELTSGARCERVQAIISSAAAGSLAGRDQRRMARHVAHCQDCRRHARLEGVAIPAAEARGARKLTGLLPLPLPQLSNALSTVEPVAAGWGKTAATLATLAIAGFGAGTVAEHGGIGNSTPPPHNVAVHRLAADVVAGARAGDAGVRGTRVKLPAAVRKALGATPTISGGSTTNTSRTGKNTAGGGNTGRDTQGEGAVRTATGDSRGGTDVGKGTGVAAGSGGSGATVPNVSTPSVPSAQAPSTPSTPQADPPKAPKVDVPSPSVPSPPQQQAPSAPATPNVPDTPKVPDAPSTPSAPDGHAASASDVQNSVPSLP